MYQKPYIKIWLKWWFLRKASSVMFHFMFVHYTFSSVWVAEWQPFGK